MTILEVAASSRIGGVETYLLRLAAHLRSENHRVIFVTRAGAPLARETRQLGFETYDWFRGGKNPLTVLKLARLMRAERVDLVHTHIFSANSLGALAAKIANVPSVARVPATEGPEHYNRSTYVTAVSQSVARNLVEQGFPARKIRVFYNGVDWKHFDRLPTKNEARNQFGLPADAFVVLCAASLTPRKGQKFLLEAISHLPADVHLLLCGEGGEEAALRETAAKLNLGNRVHFAGFLSDVRPALAASDVFVLPSLHEGLPNVVLEALAARVPAIATDIAGTPEIIESGKTGFLVPPGEVAPLLSALERLRSDAALRARFAQSGRELVESRFDGARCLDEVETFLMDAIAAWRSNKSLLPDSHFEG